MIVNTFQAWATKKGVPAAGRRLAEDWERLVSFHAFPKEHWKHLPTTKRGVVGRPRPPRAGAGLQGLGDFADVRQLGLWEPSA